MLMSARMSFGKTEQWWKVGIWLAIVFLDQESDRLASVVSKAGITSTLSDIENSETMPTLHKL